jgi:urea transporter
MALGGYFLVLRGVRVWVSIFVGVFFAFLLSAGFWNIFAPIGLPYLGLPFTLAVVTKSKLRLSIPFDFP